MKLLNTVRLVLLPILLPLSVIYGFIAYLIKIFSFKKYKSKNFVVSVGNIQAGGTGKSPFVMELAQQLLNKNINVSVVLKSYKASLKTAKEVTETDDPKTVGDEALLCKLKNPKIRVFSGPIKYKNIIFADQVVKFNGVYIVDDGAQHRKLEKNYNIIFWDFSRFFLDILPFPLGRGRELWFLSDQAHKNFVSKYQIRKPSFFCRDLKFLNFEVKTIVNPVSSKKLDQDFIFISGVGNFEELRKKVLNFISDCKMIDHIIESDHSDFKNFNPKKDTAYVCTEKDYVKLKKIINKNQLYTVKSEFSEESLVEIKKIATEIYNLCSNFNYKHGD